MFGTGMLFPCPVMQTVWHLVYCTPYNQHFHFRFRAFAGRIVLSSETIGKRWLVNCGYRHSIIKHLMINKMMNYCLSVLRSHVKRIRKHSPSFSVFRTWVHGCSCAELCYVPTQSTFGAIFPLHYQHKPRHTNFQRGLRIMCYRWREETWI